MGFRFLTSQNAQKFTLDTDKLMPQEIWLARNFPKQIKLYITSCVRMWNHYEKGL